MDIYQNVCSFIRFSKVDSEFKTPPEKDIGELLHNREPIDFVTNKVLVRIYSIDTKRSSMKQITEFVDNSTSRYNKVVLIKKNWASPIDNEKVFTYFYEDFRLDIAQLNAKFSPRLIPKDETLSDLAFYYIKRESLPVVLEDNILVKWLLGKPDDMLMYHIDTENGRSVTIRVVKAVTLK